jgi:hypothetical protein
VVEFSLIIIMMAYIELTLINVNSTSPTMSKSPVRGDIDVAPDGAKIINSLLVISNDARHKAGIRPVGA